jgi:hypothetical protein
MAIPLIIGGAALVAGIYGAKKAKDASDNYSSAKKLIESAYSDFEGAKNALESEKAAVNQRLQDLGELRLSIQSKQMLLFVETVKKINHASYKAIENDSLSIEAVAPEIGEIQVDSYRAADLVKDGIGALSAGALTGIGAGGLASSIGIASTGTAISSLSGVAATNATLAWLGGGSLAAGGMGVAGGTAILGGAIAGPVIAVMGYAYAKKSEVALTEAFKKESEVREAIAQVENGTVVIKAIGARVNEVTQATNSLFEIFSDALQELIVLVNEKSEAKKQLLTDVFEKNHTYSKKNVFVRLFNWLTFRRPTFTFLDPLDFNNFQQVEKSKYMLTINLAMSMYSILKVKILNDDGLVSSESAVAVATAQSALGASQ